ncbi:MAG: recombinase family protein [Magnetococcales bacterium]|nr:recombinase family protein [Magnetococcales bacterium]
MNRKKPTTIVTPKVRCAVYTRKSTDEGLDQEFNSLDSQREACLAYITSQKAEGWMPVADRYDDPAYSGGTLNRPALQRLMGDIDAGKVDCVVTYKLDRLSRSLADFTRLMEVFEKRSVTFVSVTQSFNTWNKPHLDREF